MFGAAGMVKRTGNSTDGAGGGTIQTAGPTATTAMTTAAPASPTQYRFHPPPAPVGAPSAAGGAVTFRAGSSKPPSSPSRTSPMSRIRSLGSFCRQRRRTPDTAGGTSTESVAQAGSVLITSARMPVTSSPANARRPVSISKSTAPNAHTSVRLSTIRPRACSGDM